MDPGGADMSCPSSVGPSRTIPSPNANPRSSTPLDRSHDSPENPLLQPVVRSRRTPIACTECRRRQVKCSGGTPRCERCEKRGIQCEYIPLHQQRAAALASSHLTAVRPQSGVGWAGGYDPSQAGGPIQASSHYWQQQGPAYAEYRHPPAPGFGQEVSAIASSSQGVLAGAYPHSAPPQLPGGFAHGNSYAHGLIPPDSGVPLVMSTSFGPGHSVTGQPQYPELSTYNQYSQADPTGLMTGSTGPGYDQQIYQQRRFSAPMSMQSSSMSAYPEQYYHNNPELYEHSAGASEPSQTPPTQWTDPNNLPYQATGYHNTSFRQ